VGDERGGEGERAGKEESEREAATKKIQISLFLLKSTERLTTQRTIR
jgi:hypothetical protein